MVMAGVCWLALTYTVISSCLLLARQRRISDTSNLSNRRLPSQLPATYADLMMPAAVGVVRCCWILADE